MNMNYEVIATMAADLSKQMLKLNNQLDKIIDKQNELRDPDEQQAAAIALIEAQQWEDAAKLCAEQAKEAAKRSKLDDDERSLREQLETLRVQLAEAAEGNTASTSGLKAVESASDDASDEATDAA